MTCARNWARDPRGQNCTGTCVQYQQVGFDLGHQQLAAYISWDFVPFYSVEGLLLLNSRSHQQRWLCGS